MNRSKNISKHIPKISVLFLYILITQPAFAGPGFYPSPSQEGVTENTTEPTTENATPFTPLNTGHVVARGYKNLSHPEVGITPEHYFLMTSEFIDNSTLLFQYDQQLYYVTISRSNVENLLLPEFRLITDHLDARQELIEYGRKAYAYYNETEVVIYRRTNQSLWAYLPNENQTFPLVSDVLLTNKDFLYIEELNKLLYLTKENKLYAYDMISHTQQLIYDRVIDYQYAPHDKKLFVLQFGVHENSYIGSVFMVDMYYPRITIQDKALIDHVSSMNYIEAEGKLFVVRYETPLHGHLYVADMLQFPQLEFELSVREVAHSRNSHLPEFRPYYAPKLEYIPEYKAVSIMAYLPQGPFYAESVPSAFTSGLTQDSFHSGFYEQKILHMVDVHGEYSEKVAMDVFDFEFNPYLQTYILFRRMMHEPILPDKPDNMTQLVFKGKQDSNGFSDYSMYGPEGGYLHIKRAGLLAYLVQNRHERIFLRVRDIKNSRLLLEEPWIHLNTHDSIHHGLSLQSEYYEPSRIKKLNYPVDQRPLLNQNEIEYKAIEFPVDPPYPSEYNTVYISDCITPASTEPIPMDAPMYGDIPHTTALENPTVEAAQYQYRINNLVGLMNSGKATHSGEQGRIQHQMEHFLHYDQNLTRYPLYMNTLIYPDGTIVKFPCEFLTLSPDFRFLIIVKRGYIRQPNRIFPKDMMFFYEIQHPETS